jgi:ribonuclease BN (tRNA processing enzyme)
VALRRHKVELNSIETVFMSHLHGDHFGGLPFLILDGQFRRRTADLTVVGPAGTRQRLAAAMEVQFPGSSEIRRRFSVHLCRRLAVRSRALCSTSYPLLIKNRPRHRRAFNGHYWRRV